MYRQIIFCLFHIHFTPTCKFINLLLCVYEMIDILLQCANKINIELYSL